MSIRQNLEQLNKVCAETLSASFNNGNDEKMNRSSALCQDLSIWSAVLQKHPESFLYTKAEQECLTALLNVSQGQYRNAFKCLRLVLELCLQGIYLSANLVELQEWLNNLSDTNWTKLKDPNFSPVGTRFCNAFFSELSPHSNNFMTMVATVYRELSEAIHGNVPNHIPLPESFVFSEEIFDIWHEKIETIRLVLIFCFCNRYLKELDETDRLRIEPIATEQLGHIESIRIFFGGPSSS